MFARTIAAFIILASVPVGGTISVANAGDREICYVDQKPVFFRESCIDQSTNRLIINQLPNGGRRPHHNPIPGAAVYGGLQDDFKAKEGAQANNSGGNGGAGTNGGSTY